MAFSFSWLDYVVMVVVACGAFSLGVYRAFRVRRRVRRSGGRTHAYAFALHALVLNHQQLRVVPTLLSLIMSHQAAVSLLGLPSEFHLWGGQWWFAGDLLAVITVPLILERFIVPWIYRQQLISVYEFFSFRFRSIAVRRLAAGLGLASTLMYMSINLSASSIALETASGLPMVASAFVIAVSACVYTLLGGMRVISWSDVGQFFLVIVGLCVIIISGAKSLGGLHAIFESAQQRLFFADFSFDPRVRLTFWSSVITIPLYNILVFGLDQASVMRYSSTPYLRSARHAVTWLVPLRMLILTLCSTCGVVIFSFFGKMRCDPLMGSVIQSPQQLVSVFMNFHFAQEMGMQGLLFATLLTATIGTISSGLSSSKITLYQDFFKDLMGVLPANRQSFINRFIVFLVAMLAFALCFFVAILPGNLMRILFTLRGIFDGPLLGLFLLGGLTRIPEWRGALAGVISGLCLTLGLAIDVLFARDFSQPLPLGSTDACEALVNITGPYRLSMHPITQNIYSSNATTSPVQDHYAISFMWLLPLGAGATFVIGTLVSCVARKVWPEQEAELDDDLLISFRGAMRCDDRQRKGKDEVEDDDEDDEDDDDDEVIPGVTMVMEEVKAKGLTDFEC